MQKYETRVGGNFISIRHDGTDYTYEVDSVKESVHTDEKIFGNKLESDRQVCIGCDIDIGPDVRNKVIGGSHVFFNSTLRNYEDIGIRKKDEYVYCILIRSFIANHEFKDRNEFDHCILMNVKMRDGCILKNTRCIVGGHIFVVSGVFKDDKDFQLHIHGLKSQ